MSPELTASTPDLIRWTFRVEPEQIEAIEGHLDDLGADVVVRDGGCFVVSWEEPEASLDPVIETLWSLNGSPFDVTQEEFHRLNLHVLQHVEDEAA